MIVSNEQIAKLISSFQGGTEADWLNDIEDMRGDWGQIIETRDTFAYFKKGNYSSFVLKNLDGLEYAEITAFQAYKGTTRCDILLISEGDKTLVCKF